MNIQKVDKNRWEQAQKWEENFWVKAQKMRAKYGKNIIWKSLALLKLKPKYRGDDWNYWWKKVFDNYAFLPNNINNGIELDCGPYTNMRLILENTNINHLFLSDPLIKTYVKFKQTFVREMYKNNFCIIDDHPIEELPFKENYFDLTVMINVLDHVYDAELCMENAIKITKKGGILIIGQDLTNENDMKNNKKLLKDIGHPIRVDHEWLDSFTKGNFKEMVYKVLTREDGRDEAHYGTYLFAGKKL